MIKLNLMEIDFPLMAMFSRIILQFKMDMVLQNRNGFGITRSYLKRKKLPLIILH